MSSFLLRTGECYLRTRWLHWVALVALLATAWMLTLGIPFVEVFNPYRIDVDVYRIGGQMMLEGRSLYGEIPPTQIGVDLPFTYPPIAAALFTVFALVPLSWASYLLSVATVAATVAVIAMTLRAVTRLRGRELVVTTVGASAILLWLDPVHQTLDFGQVNSLLMCAVVLDVVVGKGRRWRGTFTGLAIAIKLTPAVFLAFFLVRRDWRGLATAFASFVLWTGIGFLLRPADSLQYWSETLGDTGRIGMPGYASNQSLNGFVHRIAGDDVSGLWWFAGCAVVGLFVLALIHRLGDDEVTGMTAMGLYALFASPVSWSHHWVWMVPTVILVLRLALCGRGWGPWAWLAVAAASLFYGPQWWRPYEGDAAYHWSWWQHLIGNAWLWLLLGAYALFWGSARSRRELSSDHG